MKLRNLMYATMIACAFASCSKDDVVDNGGGNEKADATLSVKIANQTKADAVDTDITDLTVLIFGTDGLQKVDASGTEKTDIQVTAGAKTIVLVANAKEELATLTKTSTIDNLKAIKCIYGEENGQLTMSSKSYSVNITAGKHHYLGYSSVSADGVNLNETGMKNNPIPMFRNVAKVSLNSLKVVAKAQYGTNATFKLEGVFMLHAKKEANLVPANLSTDWATTEVSATDWIIGSTLNEYKGWAGTMEALTGVTPFKNYIKTTAATQPVPADSYYTQAVTGELTHGGIAKTTGFNSYYVYENQEAVNYQTLLVVKGKFIYPGVTEETAPTTFYPIGVGQDGVGAIPNLEIGEGDNKMTFTRTEESGVIRNLDYRISLTIKGPGKNTPFGPDPEDFTFLDVKVQVVPFGTVDQEVEI